MLAITFRSSIAQDVGILEALDLPSDDPSISFQQSGFSISTDDTHDGEDAVTARSLWSFLKLRISSPCVLDYKLKGRVTISSSSGSFMHTPKSDDWQSHQMVLPKAEGWVRFSRTSSFGAPIVIDQMQIVPFIGLSEALDSSLAFTTPVNSPGWGGALFANAHLGSDLAVPMQTEEASVPSKLQALVTGPVQLGFHLLNSNRQATRGSPTTILINGQKALNYYGNTESWLPMVIELGPGSHTVEWQATPSDETNPIALDAVETQPIADFTLTQALDLPPNQPILHGSSARPQRLVEYDGVDAVEILGAEPEVGAYAGMAIPVQGPAVVRYKLKHSHTRRLEVSGGIPSTGPSNGPLLSLVWEEHERIVGPMDTIISWDAPGYIVGEDNPVTAGWVDEVEILHPVDISAIGGPDMVVRTDPTAPWIGLPTTDTPGASGCLQTPKLSALGNTSWFEIEAAGPGLCSYWERFESEGLVAEDQISVSVNGRLVSTYSVYDQHPTNWVERSVYLPAQENLVRWTVSPRSPAATSGRCYFLANINTPPNTEPLGDLNEILDIGDDSARFEISIEQSGWQLEHDIVRSGSSALKAAEGQLEVSVDGPTVLGFWWRRYEGVESLKVKSSDSVVHTYPHCGESGQWQFTQFHIRDATQTLEIDVGDSPAILDAFALQPLAEISSIIGDGLEADFSHDPSLWQVLPNSGDGSVPGVAIKADPSAEFSLSVTGPGTLRSFYRGGSYVDFSINGLLAPPLGASKWHTRTIVLGAGEHHLRWYNSNPNFPSSALLGSITFTPGETAIADALDTTHSDVWIVDGFHWSVDTETTYDGSDALKLTTGPHGVIRALAHGPVQVNFATNHGTSANYYFKTQGRIYALGDTNGHWNYHTIASHSTGARWVEWLGYAAEEGTSNWLDSVSFTELPSFEDSIETNLTFEVHGTTNPWFGIQSSDAADGQDYLQSSLSSSRDLAASVEGPGTIRFAWRQSRYSSSPGRFLVNNQRSSTAPKAPDNWRIVERTIPSGTHTVEWTDDCELDQLSFVSEVSPRLNSVLGVNDSIAVWSAGWPEPWQADADALRSTGNTNHLHLPLEGGGICRFQWKSTSPTSDDLLRLQAYNLGYSFNAAMQPPKELEAEYFIMKPGGTTIEWGDVTSGEATIQNVELLAEQPPVSAAAALGGGLNWVTSAQRPWKGRVFGSSDGDPVKFATQNNRASADEESWLLTYASGPGVFEFDYRGQLSTDDYQVTARLLLDGAQIDNLMVRDLDWRRYRLTLPSGPHVIRWESISNDSDGTKGLMIRNVHWTARNSDDQQALGLPKSKFIASRGQKEPWHHDVAKDALRSGAIHRRGSSDMALQLDGPGMVNFKYLIEADDGNTFRVFVDDYEVRPQRTNALPGE